jgi:DNA transformation protein
MFGGWGLSVQGMNIGLILGSTLYLKTNAQTQAQWLAAGGVAFVYQARGQPVKLNYLTPPPDALESPGLMLPWARLALAAAVAARQPTPRTAAQKRTR